MPRYELRDRVVIDVIDTDINEALTSFREEDRELAEEEMKKLEELYEANKDA